MYHLYTSRYQAQKDKQEGQRIVKVYGGWVLMTKEEYKNFIKEEK